MIIIAGVGGIGVESDSGELFVAIVAKRIGDIGGGGLVVQDELTKRDGIEAITIISAHGGV